MTQVLAWETTTAGSRSAALQAAPIDVRSTLDRSASAAVRPVAASTPPSAQPPAPSTTATSTPANPEFGDDPSEWPDAAIEDAMRAELASRQGGMPATPLRERRPTRRELERRDTLDGGPLPELSTLVAQIPDPLRATLEDLFHAQFTMVKRVPAAVLKANEEPTPREGVADDGLLVDPVVEELPEDDGVA